MHVKVQFIRWLIISSVDRSLPTEKILAALIRPQDTKFTKEFVAKLTEHGVRINTLSKTSSKIEWQMQMIRSTDQARMLVVRSRQFKIVR